MQKTSFCWAFQLQRIATGCCLTRGICPGHARHGSYAMHQATCSTGREDTEPRHGSGGGWTAAFEMQKAAEWLQTSNIVDHVGSVLVWEGRQGYSCGNRRGIQVATAWVNIAYIHVESKYGSRWAWWMSNQGSRVSGVLIAPSKLTVPWPLGVPPGLWLGKPPTNNIQQVPSQTQDPNGIQYYLIPTVKIMNDYDY